MNSSKRADIAGMTTNERLFAAGLLHDFDAAARARDRDGMIKLLLQVALTQWEAERIADTVLEHPARYGFQARRKYA
jgi:hypothetical protein